MFIPFLLILLASAIGLDPLFDLPSVSSQTTFAFSLVSCLSNSSLASRSALLVAVVPVKKSLTHLSLASLWDIDRTRSPIWGYSVCLEEFYLKIK